MLVVVAGACGSCRGVGGRGLFARPCVSSRVFARASLFRCARVLGCLLVWESDGCVGGCGFSVDRLVAACDGEAVVCGASAVDAGVEGDGCWVALDGGVECVGAGFAPVSPGGAVRGVCFACSLSGVYARVCLFDHGLWCERVFWLFAGVLCARVGDPCVGDGSEGLVGA